MDGINIFQQSVQYLKGVGPKRQLCLQKLDIFTLFDLLWNIPRQYEDFSRLQSPGDMRQGESILLKGEILQIVKQRTARGMVLVKARLLCEGELVTAVWFNQPFVADILREQDILLVRGKVKRAGVQGELHITHYEKQGQTSSTSSHLLPVYSLVEGLNQKGMRQCIQDLLQGYLESYPEILPEKLRQKIHIMSIQEAWKGIHFPQNDEQRQRAHQRLALEEYILFRLMIRKNTDKPKNKQNFPPLASEEDPIMIQIRKELPFYLTQAQERVIREIREDMMKPYAMNRLLEGDVGSGKTLAAAFAMLMSKARKTQSAFMVPTEILAVQHYHSLQQLFKNTSLVIACLTSSTPARERESILEALDDGSLDILIGTHALIQQDLKFHCLGLVVIDEQHRFGVRQRALLGQKGQNPDVLVMTATPIPRTLALALSGQLQISMIDELPQGRMPVKTKYLSRQNREQAYRFAEKLILQGRLIYVICPLVEESEKQDLLDVHTLYEELCQKYQGRFSVGMVHGRMSGEEKQERLEDFACGKIQILIATTVVEVGIDVPQAAVMIIEHAERFGLSQLHQLRGRVGRSGQQSYCILLGEPSNENAYQRLLAMQNTNDGFELADLDLKLRGPGDFWGFRQHGVNDLKILDIMRDQQVAAWGEKMLPWLETHLDEELLRSYLKIKFPAFQEIAAN